MLEPKTKFPLWEIFYVFAKNSICDKIRNSISCAAKEFLDKIDNKSREKILFNIWKSREINDPRLFKKLTDEIWEFRTVYNRIQFRLFAFWVKNDNQVTLIIATHGIVKKTPKKEIEKAEQLRKDYFENDLNR